MKNRVLLFSVSLVVAASLAVALVSWRASLKFYMLEKLSHFSPRDAMCLCELGKLHYKGKGTPRSIKRSLECFQKAAALNNPKAYYKLGNILSHRFQIERGLETNPSFWDGVQFNLREALRCYRISASMGYPGACVRLGFFSFMGIGTRRSYRDAFYWYSKAADKGSVIGQWWLGYLYSHAPSSNSDENPSNVWNDIPLDYEKAIEWFTKAAEQGAPRAQSWLGYLHAHGGLFFQELSLSEDDADLNRAVDWFEKATTRNSDEALYWLVYLCYVAGSNLNVPSQKMFNWYMSAALKKHLIAQRLVGSCYEFGIGTERNFHSALTWYATASKNGDPFAKRYAIKLMKMLDIKDHEIRNTTLSKPMASPMTPPHLSHP